MALAICGRQQPRRLRPPLSHTVRARFSKRLGTASPGQEAIMRRRLNRHFVVLALLLLIQTLGCGDSQTEKRGAAAVPSGSVSKTPTTSTKYEDPKGFFTIVPPAGWETKEFAQDPRGKVAFSPPRGDARLGILAKTVDIPDYDALIRELQQTLTYAGVSMELEPIVFNNMPAVKRLGTVTIQGITRKTLFIDILADGISHNLQYASSPSTFDQYYDQAWESMKTYQVVQRAQSITQEEVRRHEVAKWLRVATLALEMGKPDAARDAVRAGLALDPTNEELKRIETTLDTR
jgi:hypothetical protein